MWVAQARDGDTAAFARLMETYQSPVYNLAYRMLGDPAEAEDAAQKTFVRAYVHLNSCRETSKFSSWLLSIASHHCVDLLRRRRTTWLSVEDLPGRVEADLSTVQPEQEVIMHQTTDKVQQLLSTLDPAYRVPVVLRYWYDMPCQEIAKVMGIGEGTVKTRLYRAREKLAREAQKVRQPQRHLMQKPDVFRSVVDRRSAKEGLLLEVW